VLCLTSLSLASLLAPLFASLMQVGGEDNGLVKGRKNVEVKGRKNNKKRKVEEEGGE